jgi:hypothetical protein
MVDIARGESETSARILIAGKCTTDQTDLALVIYGYWAMSSVWREIARLVWTGASTNNPAENVYRLQPLAVDISQGVEHVAVGKTSGTGTWTVEVQQG